MSSNKSASIDIALGATGVAFGSASLTFPFGRDQGLFYYVAREWLLRGSIPYRDLFDDQTPGIYGIHAIAIALFGETMWGIRLLDLVCVVMLGLIASSFSAEPKAPIVRGVRGCSVLVASVLYYGFSNFWNSAQIEIWVATFALASIWAARRIESRPRAEIISGVLGAFAILLKPASAWLVALALAICISRVRAEPDRARRMSITGARFIGALAIPIALTLGYFASHDALSSMSEILVDAGGYVGRESSVHGVRDLIGTTLFGYQYYSPLAAALFVELIITIAIFHRRADFPERNRHLLIVLIGALSFLAVLVQKRFFLFHWSIFIGPATAAAANAMVDISRATREMKQRAWIRSAAVLAAVLAWTSSGDPYRTWVSENKSAIAFLRGRIDREEFSRRFALPVLGFSDHDSEEIGAWLKAHSNPDDFIAVRGFEPEIYAIADRRYSGRFFWTIFLTSPSRSYGRDRWLAEDAAAFDAHRPRFVVTIDEAQEGPDAAETYILKGYEPRTEISGFTILEAAR